MLGLDLPEVIIILAVLGILLFGGDKMREFARTLGRFSGEFKKGKLEMERELEESMKEVKEGLPTKHKASEKVDKK